MPSITQFDVQDDRKLRNSLNRVQEKTFDGIFNGFLGAGEFIDSTGSTGHILVGGKALALKYLSGADNSAEAMVRVDPNWIKGDLHVTIFYSGTSTSNNFKGKVHVTPIAVGEAVDSSETTVTEDLIPPGTTKLLLSHLFNPFPMDANDSMFTIRVERAGTSESPANSGDFYLFAIGWRFYASRI